MASFYYEHTKTILRRGLSLTVDVPHLLPSPSPHRYGWEHVEEVTAVSSMATTPEKTVFLECFTYMQCRKKLGKGFRLGLTGNNLCPLSVFPLGF